MSKSKYDPERALGNCIVGLSREALCEFTVGLCAAVKNDVGTGKYRGGIFPSNLSANEDGSLSIGPASPGAWEGEELRFVAPELYWNGKRSPASDVYSIGLVMYYSASGGKLPFEDECKDAQLRRMSGAEIVPPHAAGRRLGEIIQKAVSFKPEDRYQSMDELKAVLEGCLKNVFAPGVTAAEAVFGKNDDDLSDIERMMVEIMEKGVLSQDAPEPPVSEPMLQPEHEDEQPSAAEAPGEEEEELPTQDIFFEPAKDEDFQVYVPEDRNKTGKEFAAMFGQNEPETEKEPDMEPINFFEEPADVKYSKNIERERVIRQEVKKRRARPLVFIGILCALLIIAALVFSRLSKDSRRAEFVFGPAEPPVSYEPVDISVPTPDPNVVGNTQAPKDETPEVVEPPKEHSYEIFVDDVSWTEAQQRCESMGGHLVTISDVDELGKVTALAEREGITRVWVGCQRVNGEMTWVNGEDINFYPWAKGEPSFIDSGDDVDEDYVLLWDHNGWCYNDSRNDPVADYPEMYEGNLAFVCEIGD